MPTEIFQGIIQPFPSITVDYFAGLRHCVEAFFLSHCHTDHIKGVHSDEFKQLLNERPGAKIYCTLVTAQLLLKRNKDLDHLTPHFVHVTEGEWMTVLLGNSSLNVRTIPAHHCLGSVMFLFEDSTSSALYTGDFRYNETSHREEMKAHLSSSSRASVNHLYLDTTFYTPREPLFHSFPSRRESELAVIDLVKQWRSSNPAGKVHIDVTVGWENIFKAVSEFFDCDVVITEEHCEEYEDIKDVIFYLVKESLSKASDWLHVNKTNKACTLCEGPDRVMKIRPSVQWLKHNKRPDESSLVYNKSGDEWYVTHSMHSSYNELQQFIQLVDAEKVHAIALPHGVKDEEMRWEMRRCWKSTTVNKTTDLNNKTTDLNNKTTDLNNKVKSAASNNRAAAPKVESESEGGMVSSESDDIPMGDYPTPLKDRSVQEKAFESPITPPSLMELASSLEGLDVSPQKRHRVKRCTKKRTNRQIFDRDSGNSSQEEDTKKRKRRQIKIDINSSENDVGSFIDALGKPEALQGSSRDVESFDSRFEDMLYADILKAEQFTKEGATPPSSLEVSLELATEQPQIKVEHAADNTEQMDLLYDSCDDMFNMEHVKTPEVKLQVNDAQLDWMFDSPPGNSPPASSSWAPTTTTTSTTSANIEAARLQSLEEVYRIFNDSDS